MMLKILLFFLSLTISLFAKNELHNSYALTQNELAYLKTHKTISFNGHLNWLPYEAIDDNGNYIGIVADYLHLIEKRLNITFDKEAFKSTADAHRVAINTKADVISSDASDTVLSKNFKPIDTFLKNPIVIVMKHSHTYIESIDQIADKRIAIIKGYAYTADILSCYPHIDFVEVKNVQEGLLGVESGKYDAMLASLAHVSYTMVQMGLEDLDIVSKTDVVINLTLFVNKEKELLYSALNKAMSSINASEQQIILARWRHEANLQRHNYSLLWTILGLTALFFSFLLYRQVSLKRHADDLRGQQELYELVFKNSISGVLMADFETGRFIDCNEQAVKMLACDSKDDVLHLLPSDISPKLQPDGRNSLEKMHEKNDLIRHRGSLSFEWQHLKKTGETFWVEVIATAIFLDDKKVLHVVWKDIQERKDHEAALAKLNERLDYAVSGTNDGLWDWDMTKEDTIYLSPRFKEMAGYKDDEFTNSYSAWKARIHPDDLTQTLDAIERAIENPKIPYRSIHRFKHKDGHWIWILNRGRVILDKTGTPVRMVGFYTDITQIKLLETQLLEKETIYRNTLNSVENIIFVKGKDFRYIECNPSFERLSGVSRENIIGKDDYDIWDKDVADNFRKYDTMMFESETTQENYEWVTYPDGSKVYLLTSKTPLRNPDGEVLGLVGNAVDVTKEYIAQREISKLKSALERSPISIMMTDIDGNIEYVNPNYTKISGYTLEELLGQNPRIVKSGATSDEQYKKMWQQISSGHIYSSDIKNIAKDGSYFWENSTILPTFNDQHQVDGYIAFKLDITDKINMQRELQDKEELMVAQSRHAAMGEMISMIAHQWRQPITVIAMGANNMIADIELQDMNEDSFRLEARSILEQTHYLSKTIDDFRDFFRPNKGKEEVYINDIMNEAVGIIGKSLEHSDITLSIENSSTASVTLYSRELLQVFMNLLKNAKEALVEHTAQERRITITIHDTSANIITSICDNGGGISESILDKIFDPYFSTKDEQIGTGLGLYMSKTIIDKHIHGSITATSSGETTCFEVSIPKILRKER